MPLLAVRLPGAGGAPEIAATWREVLVLLRQTRRTFDERVDFVTSVGFGREPGDLGRLGLAGAGPTAVITDLSVLEPDPDDGELVLVGLHPGVTLADARTNTGWPLRVQLRISDPPAAAELDALLRLEATKGS